MLLTFNWTREVPFDTLVGAGVNRKTARGKPVTTERDPGWDKKAK